MLGSATYCVTTLRCGSDEAPEQRQLQELIHDAGSSRDNPVFLAEMIENFVVFKQCDTVDLVISTFLKKCRWKKSGPGLPPWGWGK
jgi:hypothetical protein